MLDHDENLTRLRGDEIFVATFNKIRNKQVSCPEQPIHK